MVDLLLFGVTFPVPSAFGFSPSSCSVHLIPPLKKLFSRNTIKRRFFPLEITFNSIIYFITFYWMSFYKLPSQIKKK
jgi:hypothetical protein